MKRKTKQGPIAGVTSEIMFGVGTTRMTYPILRKPDGTAYFIDEGGCERPITSPKIEAELRKGR